MEKHIIDLSADPFCPENWIRNHQLRCDHARGEPAFEWDPAKVILWQHADQHDRGWRRGYYHESLIENCQHCVNANMLDYLLDHPYLIPEDWKKAKRVYFLGTVYYEVSWSGHFKHEMPYVRYLMWDGRRWIWGYEWPGSDWIRGWFTAFHFEI